MNKEQARKLAKNKRDNLDKGLRVIKDNIIIQKVEKDIRFKTAKIIGTYYPINSEVDISKLTHLYASFAYPVIDKDEMNFVLINNKTKWKKNKFGIMEPIKGKIVNDEIDLLLVPTLAKNKENYRIGYGKGYYDRFIKKHSPKITIGIIYDRIELNFINDIWDIPLDDYISN